MQTTNQVTFTNQRSSLYQAIDKYTSQNLEIIRLASNTKNPLDKGWNRISGTRYSHNDADYELNMGILCGGSNNLFVLDFDTQDYPEWVSDVIETIFSKTKTVYTKRGMHVYFTANAPIASSAGKGFDIKGQSSGGTMSFVVAPPSTVEGFAYMDNGKPIHKLDNYELTILESNIPNFSTIDISDNVSPKFMFDKMPRSHKKIIVGDYSQIKDNLDRSALDMKVLKNLEKDGYTYKDALGLYIAYGSSNNVSRFGETWNLQFGGQKKACDYLWGLWRGLNTLSTRKPLDACIDFLWNNTSELFSGRTKRTDTLLFRALLWHLKRSGNEKNLTSTFSASVRDIMMITSLSQDTIYNSRSRLIEKGYIEIVKGTKKDKDPRTTKYKLKLDIIKDISSLVHHYYLFISTSSDVPISNYLCEISPDIIDTPILKVQDIHNYTLDYNRRKAFNGEGSELISFINSKDGEPVTIKEVAEHLGVSYGCAKNKLLKLVDLMDAEEVVVKTKTRPTKGFVFKNLIKKRDKTLLARNAGTLGSKNKRDNQLIAEQVQQRKNRKDWTVTGYQNFKLYRNHLQQ